jgi:hypothetical protein
MNTYGSGGRARSSARLQRRAETAHGDFEPASNRGWGASEMLGGMRDPLMPGLAAGIIT